MTDDNRSTKVSDYGDCNHRDLCGDSLIEAYGELRLCSACGKCWRDVEVVIVNDETR